MFLNADYDVYVWDLEAGVHPSRLYNTVQEVSAGNLVTRHESFHHRRLNVHVLVCHGSESLSSSTNLDYH